MLSKISALILLVPFASGLTIQTPSNVTSGGQTVLSWTTTASDPSTFSVELINTVFNNAFAIANNVQSSLGSLSVNLPIVPSGDGYTIQAVAISNISDVFAATGDFAIAPTVTSSSSSSTSSASGSSASTSRSGITSSASSSGFGTTVTTLPSSSGFGTTVTTPPLSTSGASSTGSSSTGSATTPATSNFNAATSLSFGFGGAAKYGVAFLAAIAGAAAFAL